MYAQPSPSMALANKYQCNIRTIPMRHIDITCPHSPPATHPYVTTLLLDPSDVAKFERLFANEPAVKILGIDQSPPDKWRVFVACASRATQDLLESGW
jgi:hypothetical protein